MIKSHLQQFFLLLSILTLSSGCYKLTHWGEPDKKPETPSSATDTAIIPGGSGTLTSTQYLTVSVETDKAASYWLHQAGAGNERALCRLDKATVNGAATDMHCYLEAEELDLYYNGVNFTVNIPPGVCDYVTYQPYSFWKRPAGNSNYLVDRVSVTTGCTTCNGGACPATNAQLPLPFEFNHATEAHPEYPNCDEGVINYRYTNYVPLDPTIPAVCVASTTIERVKGGGLYKNCLSGPGVAFGVTSDTGMPVEKIYNTGLLGMNVTYENEAPIGRPNRSGNYFLANFTNACSTGASTYSTENLKLYSNTSTTYTHALAAVVGTKTEGIAAGTSTYIGADPYKGLQPFYEVGCYNKAREVKARIRIQIRDWDRTFDIDADGLDESIPVLMDSSGSEGAGTGGTFGNFNDYGDIDEFTAAEGRTVDCTTPAVDRDLNEGFSFINEDL